MPAPHSLVTPRGAPRNNRSIHFALLFARPHVAYPPLDIIDANRRNVQQTACWHERCQFSLLTSRAAVKLDGNIRRSKLVWNSLPSLGPRTSHLPSLSPLSPAGLLYTSLCCDRYPAPTLCLQPTTAAKTQYVYHGPRLLNRLAAQTFAARTSAHEHFACFSLRAAFTYLPATHVPHTDPTLHHFLLK